MAKLKNHTLRLDYPVYTARFLNNNTLLVAGGGGEGNNGVPNKMTVIAVQPENTKKPLKRYRELVLNDKEDSVMSLDASNGTILAGINENSAMMRKGVNKHLRKFKFVNDHLKFVQSCQIHANSNSTLYQKITAISQDGNSGAIVMSDNPSTVYIIDCADDLEEKYKIMTDGDVKDVSISPDGKLMTYITTATFEAISMVTGRSVFKSNVDFSMSRVRFINNDEAIISGAKETNAVVAKFSIAKSKVVLQKVVCKNLKGITSMDVNVASDLIALSTSDYSILIVRVSDLKLVKKLNNVHKFAITKVVFSDNGKFLASGSAANTVNVVEISEGLAKSRSMLASIFYNLLAIIIIGVLAVGTKYLQQHGYIDLAYAKAMEMYESYKPKDSSNYFVVEEVDSNMFSSTSFAHQVADITAKSDIVSKSGDVSITSVTSMVYTTNTSVEGTDLVSELPPSTASSEEELTSKLTKAQEDLIQEVTTVQDGTSQTSLTSAIEETTNDALNENTKREVQEDTYYDAKEEIVDTAETTEPHSPSILRQSEPTPSPSPVAEVPPAEEEPTPEVPPTVTPLTTESAMPTEITKEVTSTKEVVSTREVTSTREVISTREVTSTKEVVQTKVQTEVLVVTRVETEVLLVTSTVEAVKSSSEVVEPTSEVAVASPEVGTNSIIVDSESMKSEEENLQPKIIDVTTTIDVTETVEVAVSKTVTKELSVSLAVEPDSTVLTIPSAAEPTEEVSIEIEPESQTFEDPQVAKSVADKEAIRAIEETPAYSIQIEPEIKTFTDAAEASAAADAAAANVIEDQLEDQLEAQLSQN